jgi:putative ABC transport system permease protein
MRLTRRFFPRRASFALRQGVANLFRPHNQTIAITLAVGFGVFLIATLYVVQRNLLDQILRETRPDRPNLLIFDIQLDQQTGVDEILKRYDAPLLQSTPIVPARIAKLGDRRIEEILADTIGPRVPRWALLREYRHTYRDSLVSSEQLVAGKWFVNGDRADADMELSTPRVSLEESIAEELNVWVGDRISWDIQGVPIETEITSVRRVDWARFEPNFFAVFEPGVLDDAPQSMIVLTRANDATQRAEIQRDLVLAYQNVSAIDLTTLLDAIDSVLRKVALAIRFMALFSVASGLVILIGAIATSRYQRTRESVLLKTLGARSRTIRRVLGIEYFALGFFAGLTGVVAAAIAAWVAVRFLFELSFELPGLPLLAFWLTAALLTTVIGLVNSRDVIRRTPLAGLRDFAE